MTRPCIDAPMRAQLVEAHSVLRAFLLKVANFLNEFPLKFTRPEETERQIASFMPLEELPEDARSRALPGVAEMFKETGAASPAYLFALNSVRDCVVCVCVCVCVCVRACAHTSRVIRVCSAVVA